MIQRLYFPQLVSEFRIILETRQLVCVFIDEQHNRMLKETREIVETREIDKAVWRSNYNKEPYFSVDTYNELSGKYMKYIDEFVPNIILSSNKIIEQMSIKNIIFNKVKNYFCVFCNKNKSN
jgi:hypothetical protein